ncbi:hypothetical protein [Brucella gallinifaecis]|uniref:hypothetical protein n=1 Tax=Brucella gallinifaecis TaxID=215590 RepID=UPI0023626B66|nr:hypothetical protein [Brucella gallinifaecis]
MAINVRKAARFVQVRGSHANTLNESVDILFDGEDGNAYAIEIDHSIISALLAAIMGESRELHANLPTLVDKPTQGLGSTGMSLSMASDGSLAWRISLEGDIHFDLAFSPDQFEELDRQMDEVRSLLRHRQ